MASRVHRPHEVIAFNVNGIERHSYELRKQLKYLHIDMAVFLETCLKPHERFYIPIYHFYQNDCHLGRKDGTAIAIRIGILHNHAGLPPLIPAEATGVCIPTGNTRNSTCIHL
jgi:hypothetical protein